MQVDLFDGEPPASRPAWRVIEAARHEHLTGELALSSNPPTNVYLINGEVYFAERTTDGAISVRLLVEGVISRKQMSKGSVMVSGAEHLGRLFERDASIDRDAVELCVELMTDDVLTSVSKEMVDSYVMTLYKRHSSGIDRWLPNQSTADAPPVNEEQREAAFSALQPPVLNGTSVAHVALPEPILAEPTPLPETTLPETTLPEPIWAPAISQPVPATVLPTLAPISAQIAAPAPVPTPTPAPVLEPALTPSPEPVGRTPERLQLAEWPVSATEPAAQHATLPKRAVPTGDSYPTLQATNGTTPAAAPASPAAAVPSTIAAEVADAVRRALAAIDSVLTPGGDDSADKSPPRPL